MILLRLNFGSGYRIYFTELDNAAILLLCAGDKNTQKKDIENAKNIGANILEKPYNEIIHIK